jgi:hypothetical protein
MVQLSGLEPPTSCSIDRRSNQLSYTIPIRHVMIPIWYFVQGCSFLTPTALSDTRFFQ